MAGLVAAGLLGPAWPLKPTVFLLGVSNGAFSIAAIGSMMALASQGRARPPEGVRMGLWGAAQAVAFGIGGLLGAAASDVARHLIGTPGAAYATVFAVEGLMFLLAALLARRVAMPAHGARPGAQATQPAQRLSTARPQMAANLPPPRHSANDLGAAA